jgi:hypothetical protein
MFLARIPVPADWEAGEAGGFNGGMRTGTRLLVLLLVLVAALGAPPAEGLPAVEEPPAVPTTTAAPQGGGVDLLPGPDAGTPPQDAGDRGGAGQLAMFGLVVAGLLLIIALAVRDARRSRARRAGAGR